MPIALEDSRGEDETKGIDDRGGEGFESTGPAPSRRQRVRKMSVLTRAEGRQAMEGPPSVEPIRERGGRRAATGDTGDRDAHEQVVAGVGGRPQVPARVESAEAAPSQSDAHGGCEQHGSSCAPEHGELRDVRDARCEDESR